MHDNGRASTESSFSLLSLIVFLIREEAWALWVVKPRRWCFTSPKVSSARGRLTDGCQNECDFKGEKRATVLSAPSRQRPQGKKTVRGDMLIFCRDRPPAVIQSHENIVGWNEEEWANTTQNNQITGVVLVPTQPHKLPECWDLTSPFSENPLIHLEKNPIPTVFRYETLVSTEGGEGADSREFYCYCYWRLRMQWLQCGFSRTAQHILIKRKTKDQHWRLFAESDRLWQDF